MAATKNLNISVSGNGVFGNIKVTSLNITRALGKLAVADFKSVYPFDVNSDIKIKINGRDIFGGIVKLCEKSSDKNTYRISAEPLASTLINKYFIAHDKPNIVIKYKDPSTDIPNPISYYIGCLPCPPIQSASDGNDYDSLIHIPFTSIDLPDMQFGRMTIYKTYETFFSMLNIPYWFDDGSTVPVFGLCRSVKPLQLPQDYILDSINEQQLYIPKYDSVAVIDDTRKKQGVAGAVSDSGNLIGDVQAVYQYDGKHNIDTLTAMANEIYVGSGNTISRWKVIFEPGAALQFKEGDIIQAIGDETVNPIMPYLQGSGGLNITGYRIYQIDISNESTILYLGSARLSVFDIYKDRLCIVDGTNIPTSDTKIESHFLGLHPGSS